MRCERSGGQLHHSTLLKALERLRDKVYPSLGLDNVVSFLVLTHANLARRNRARKVDADKIRGLLRNAAPSAGRTVKVTLSDVVASELGRSLAYWQRTTRTRDKSVAAYLSAVTAWFSARCLAA